MFKHRLNGANSDRVNRASSACVAFPDGSPLSQGLEVNTGLNESVLRRRFG